MTISQLGSPSTLARSASALQLRAVYSAMRVLAEDDRERGAGIDEVIRCLSCRRDRPAPGSVAYADRLFCNGCATDFEVLRIAGVVADLDGYLSRPAGEPA